MNVVYIYLINILCLPQRILRKKWKADLKKFLGSHYSIMYMHILHIIQRRSQPKILGVQFKKSQLITLFFFSKHLLIFILIPSHSSTCPEFTLATP